MSASTATLVFPAVNQPAVEYLRAARERGERTVCAASVACDEIAAAWGGLHRLPSIHDGNFSRRFLSLIKDHGIARLFCPVASVHVYMRRFIDEHCPDVKLIGQSPIRQQVEQHRQLMARARRLLLLVEQCAQGTPYRPSLLELAGVLKQASIIYGESDDDKIAAMMGIFASAPKGDVIEIGSLMGRSAFVLLYLAWRHRVGPVLTIDPWSANESIQRESPASLQPLVDEWDCEALSEGFFVNMVPFRADDHAHLRMSAANAFQVYSGGAPILSRLAEPIGYSGKIGVIHIDGNHDYACVKRDCELWLDRLLPGAWLILDDYVWAHGDGPWRAGNELLAEQQGRIGCAFVCGKALFVKFHY